MHRENGQKFLSVSLTCIINKDINKYHKWAFGTKKLENISSWGFSQKSIRAALNATAINSLKRLLCSKFEIQRENGGGFSCWGVGGGDGASYLNLELVTGFDLLSERAGKRQQPALIHVEATVLVAADDVEGEGRAVSGCVPVRHHQLDDTAADGLALLQETASVRSASLTL